MTRASGAYPDNAAVFARKAKARKEGAGLSFAEKLVLLDRLRESSRAHHRSARARAAKPDAENRAPLAARRIG